MFQLSETNLVPVSGTYWMAVPIEGKSIPEQLGGMMIHSLWAGGFTGL